MFQPGSPDPQLLLVFIDILLFSCFSLAPLTPAIAAGNCAVVKPSEIAPATAKAIQDLLPKYLDNHCFKVWSKPLFKLSFLLSL